MKTCSLALAFVAVSCLPVLAGPPDAKDMKGMAPAMMTESDAGFYVGVFGGANVSQDYGNGRSEFSGPGGVFVYRGDTSNHVGGVGGIKAGYNFDSFALGGDFRLQPAVEGEAYYIGTKTDVHSRFNPGDDFDITGNMNNAVGMINGLIRLKTGTLFTPYIGAGIGTEYINFTRPRLAEEGDLPVAPDQNANDFTPAVQAVGGFDFALTKHLSLFTEYKYVVAINPSLDFGNANVDGETFNLKIDPYELGQHVVTAGVKYNF